MPGDAEHSRHLFERISRHVLPALPPPAKATAPAVASAKFPPAPPRDEPDEEKKYDRADSGVEDQGENSGAEMNVQSRQQPIADKRADNSDDQISDKPDAAAFHDIAGQPACDNADEHDDEKAFVRQVHGDQSPLDKMFRPITPKLQE